MFIFVNINEHTHTHTQAHILWRQFHVLVANLNIPLGDIVDSNLVIRAIPIIKQIIYTIESIIIIDFALCRAGARTLRNVFLLLGKI